mmetsp:Transcript_34935/g.75283  ORF Transcript_34935/g.75283 Transcript_34935/m.75283 type:complete len:858 (-) Transcript_34935:72-2645(-)
MGDNAKLFGAGVCCCCCGVIPLIIFCVFMSAYLNLQPNEQLVFRSGSSYTAKNGPWAGQVNPFKSRTRRQALKLDATQYAKLRDRVTYEYRVVLGPYFGFMEAQEELYKTKNKIVLERDQYVRIINQYTGLERIERGPSVLYENATDNFDRMRIVTQTAVYLNQETAAMVADMNTAVLSLVRPCDVTDTLYVPDPLIRVLEERKLTYVKPYEVLVVRDQNGGTLYYDGSLSNESQYDYQCPNEAEESAGGGGLAFWLPPYSRIVRMVWSNYSTRLEEATSISATTTSTSTRRRRTSRNPVINSQNWAQKPRMWFVAGDYNKETDIWVNRGTGANLSNVVTQGSVTISDSVGSGASANMVSIVGSTSTIMNFGSLVTSSYFTVCAMTRYAGSARRQILRAGDGLWHGHNNATTGIARYAYTNLTEMLYDVIEPITEWVPMCVKTGLPPNNVMILDEAVGTDFINYYTPPSWGINTNSLYKSDFAIAEIITWNTELSDLEVEEVMLYFKARMMDAKTYYDQAHSLSETASTKMITAVDTRMQRSYYNFEVRSQDNVKLTIEGTVYWQIVNVPTTISGTSDPEGDVWYRTRSTLISAIGSVTVSQFMANFNEIVRAAFETQQGSAFFTSRGIELIDIDILDYYPMDERTIASLNTIIQTKTERMVALAQQETENELRAIEIAANVAMEDNKTILIEAEALNQKLQAETRGATEGGRKATTVNSFLDGIEDMIPDLDTRVQLYREHLVRQALLNQTKNLFSNTSKVYMKPAGQNLTLLLPTDIHYDTGYLDERRMSGSLPLPGPDDLGGSEEACSASSTPNMGSVSSGETTIIIDAMPSSASGGGSVGVEAGGRTGHADEL